MEKKEKRLRLKIGNHYQIYDGFDKCKVRAKYLGITNDNSHVFVFGERENKQYAYVDDYWAHREEIITHAPIAPCGFTVLSKSEIKDRRFKASISGLLKLLQKRGEKI